MTSGCKCDNEPSVYIKCGEFLNWLRNCWLLRKNCLLHRLNILGTTIQNLMALDFCTLHRKKKTRQESEKLTTRFKILTLRKGKENKGNSFILTSLFLIILMNNFLGLFPYIFTTTRHLTLALYSPTSSPQPDT